MKIKFVPQDLWLGLYWKTLQQMIPICRKQTTFYLCIVPMFPIIWTINHKPYILSDQN